MSENTQRDLFAPILRSDALMGPFLLTARLFTLGIFFFYIEYEVKMGVASVPLYLTMAIQAAGIVLVALGFKARFGALLLIAGVAASLVFRPHFGLTDYNVTGQKDLALAGGLLFMFAYGAGPLSVDRYRSRKRMIEAETPGGDFPSVPFGNATAMGLLLLVGRLISTVVFYVAGTFKTLHTPVMQAYMVKHNSSVPINLIYLAILTQLVAPTLVALGYKTRYGALALSGFCIIATALFHADFGNASEVEQFLLDFAIAGGFLFMFAQGPGPFSFDANRFRSGTASDRNLAVKKGDVSLVG
jgi:putative oxidoreductase